MSESVDAQESLKNATDNLADQAKKLEIASYYTHGDFEKAKNMLAGTYKDAYAIKINFSSSSVYGAALIFINSIYLTVQSIYGVVSHSFTVSEIKTNQDWKEFEKQIGANIALGEHDDVLGAHMRDELTNGIIPQFITDLQKLIDAGEEISVNHHFQKLVTNKLGFQNIKIGVDFEQITSLDMELNSTNSKKIDPYELEKRKREEENKLKEKENAAAGNDDPLQGKEIKLILNGSLILSPIKGRDIGDLIVGDRVMIKILDKSNKAISLAKAFNAYNDGILKPIAGRIVSIKKISGGGYKIFVIVAKGIFLKIEEEEETIKVAMDPATMAADNKSESQPMSVPLIITLVSLFLGLVGIVVYFLQ